MYLSCCLEAKFTESWDRDYNSSIGRFISNDPIGFKGEDGNLYRALKNGPLDKTDPFGENSLYKYLA
ncbi:MAG: hypothetical protein NXH75_06660, partial [Halobacteriovoraceae bacterium]|nr:hypothetical protein [Halobacteriovoraceae bacterium]